MLGHSLFVKSSISHSAAINAPSVKCFLLLMLARYSSNSLFDNSILIPQRALNFKALMTTHNTTLFGLNQAKA
jgi:hypothetical protein